MIYTFHPRFGKVPFVPNSEQAMMFDAFKRFRRVVIKKDRQIGATVCLGSHAMVEALSTSDYRILVLTARRINIKNFLRKISDSGSSCEALHSRTSSGIQFLNGSSIDVKCDFSPSERYDLVILDEYEWSDVNISDVLPIAKKLIAASSARTQNSFAGTTLKVVDSENCEMQSHPKLTIFGVV